ncbi:MAG: DUF4129 domain-containing protein [Lacisediminihabitans sp.]
MIAVAAALVGLVPTGLVLPGNVPVDPDAGQAQQWIIEELSKPAYQAAQPTWFDRLSSAFWDWLNSLDLSKSGAAGGPVLVVVALVILAALVAAFLLFGPPRLNRRSTIPGALFGEDDNRSAAAIRQTAEAAAREGDWTTAIEEMFRSIARGLAERTVLTTSPGTTARGFAARAGQSFPPLAGRLGSAAAAFDEVRYLGRAGAEPSYRETAELERDLRGARPVVERAPAGSTQ